MSDPTPLTFWLVERGQSEGFVPPVYYASYASKTKWTSSVAEAVRFASRSDAALFIDHQFEGTGITARPVEHGFLDTTYHRRRVARRRSEHPMSDPTREALIAAGKELIELLQADLDVTSHTLVAARDFVEAAISTTPAPLDVSRLARALHRVQSVADGHGDPTAQPDESCRIDAEAIAREYAKP